MEVDAPVVQAASGPLPELMGLHIRAEGKARRAGCGSRLLALSGAR